MTVCDWFPTPKRLDEILLGLFLTEAPNTGKVVETRKARHNLYTLATRLFDHRPNSNRPRHCCASVAIGRMYDDVATRVPLHELASRGPSVPNRTDGRTNTGLSHNIYRASIASQDKNLIYLSVGHLRSLIWCHWIEDAISCF